MTGDALLVELTRVRLAELAPDAVLVVPFGAIEQHGPHLPFGTDFMIVDAVARRACERAGADAGVVLAPTVAYGSSAHHLAVGGALSLAAPTFEACARDLLASAAGSGFRRAFLLNGHGGNEQLLRVAATAAAGAKQLVVGGGSYWTLARPALERLVPKPSLVPGHAGRFETSLVRALRPDLVAVAPSRDDWSPAEETPYWHEDWRSWQSIDGYTDDPAVGSADEGMACLDAVVEAVAACILDFARATDDLELQ